MERTPPNDSYIEFVKTSDSLTLIHELKCLSVQRCMEKNRGCDKHTAEINGKIMAIIEEAESRGYTGAGA